MIEEQKAQGKRMDKLEGRSGEDLEEQNKIIQKLTLSIKESELSMKNMIEEQKEQGKRLDKLEKRSGEEWEAMKKHLIHTILGVLAAALASGMIYLIAQNL